MCETLQTSKSFIRFLAKIHDDLFRSFTLDYDSGWYDILNKELIVIHSETVQLTVLRIIKLKCFRFRWGFAPVPVYYNFGIILSCLRYLRTLYIMWNLVRRRVTRCLIRLQTMCNVPKYRITFYDDSVRLRFGFGYFFNLLMFITVTYAPAYVPEYVTIMIIAQHLLLKISKSYS